MLPNEEFALACRAYYDEMGLIVDETNGEFAHSPYPASKCETGYYLLWEHHQQQGILQSRDVDECCFFIGHAKKWLLTCDPFPDDYFTLWEIYEKYAYKQQYKNGKKVHEEKDEFGRSVQAVKNAEITNQERDELGRCINGVRSMEKLHEEKNEEGKSLHGLRCIEKTHSKKDERGKSLAGVVGGRKGAATVHSKKDELGRSLHGVRLASISHSQVWESTKDGFRGNAGNVAQHNKRNGWDPNARIRIA